MAAFSSLSTGVSALQGHQVMMRVIANNLANANTVGFKSQRAQFQDLLYQSLAQGTNPNQVGLGVVASSVSSNQQQGDLQSTGQSLDLALQGDGYFIVNDGRQDLYTRAGTFQVNQDGYVVDSTTGYRVQRFGNLGEATATTPAFQTAGDTGIQIPLGRNIPGVATSSVELGGNLNASLATGDTLSTAIQVFDTQGTAHALTLIFTKTAANTFSVDGSVSGGTITGLPAAGISFNADGTLNTPASIAISVSYPPDLPAVQNISLELGTPGETDGLSQLGGNSSVTARSQDGSASGTLASYSVDQSGMIQGIFSNGRILTLAQLAIASFANPQGLSREGDNYYSYVPSSGPPQVGSALSGTRGGVQAGALESANVDVASELTMLIIAQRGFQANARVVSTSNNILEELVNLIR